MNTKALMTSNRNDWETPWKSFDELNNEFHFTLDPCASDTNHKCDKYFTKKADWRKIKALQQKRILKIR